MKSDLIVNWDALSRADWDRLHAAAGAAMQQDWAYGDAMRTASSRARVLRAHITRADGETLAIAQIVSRAFAGLARLALCTLGPVWIGEVSAADRRRAHKALKAALPLPRPRLLVVTPDAEDAGAAGVKGFSRVMTGDATVLVDLAPEPEALRAALDPKWRNKLGKAEKSAIRAQRGGTKPAQYRWLLEAETAQRAKRGYRALPPDLTEAWQQSRLAACPQDKSGGLALYRASEANNACAGMLFLLHGSRATYHIGWTNEVGRSNAAHNLLLWTAMLELREQGVKELDLGGVNTQSGAGIARFKIGTGGRVLQRAGSYV
ncbi:MAG: GNAT family N-acetyltransferase [Hyphomonadaceae bacterium]